MIMEEIFSNHFFPSRMNPIVLNAENASLFVELYLTRSFVVLFLQFRRQAQVIHVTSAWKWESNHLFLKHLMNED